MPAPALLSSSQNPEKTNKIRRPFPDLPEASFTAWDRSNKKLFQTNHYWATHAFNSKTTSLVLLIGYMISLLPGRAIAIAKAPWGSFDSTNSSTHARPGKSMIGSLFPERPLVGDTKWGETEQNTSRTAWLITRPLAINKSEGFVYRICFWYIRSDFRIRSECWMDALDRVFL